MSLIDWIILIAAVGAVVGAVALSLYRRKHGKSSCGCDCGQCASRGSCQNKR